MLCGNHLNYCCLLAVSIQEVKGKATICVLTWCFCQTPAFFFFMYSNCIATMFYLLSYPFKSLPWMRSALLLTGYQLESAFWWQQWLWHRTTEIHASKRKQNSLAPLIRTDLKEGPWGQESKVSRFRENRGLLYLFTMFVSSDVK